MEDLKQIQEFFSKPLEEGEQLDIIDLAKVVQAVTKTGHPVTVLLTPKWNEIEIITGLNAPDDMLFDLSNAVDSLGYGRNDIIIAANSSNLSRREYSDIRRVNGGHKDYFEESLNEDKEKAINYFQQAIKLSHTNKVRNLILKAVRELGLEVPKVWTESLDESALGFNDSRLSSDQHRDLDYAVRGDSAYTFGNDPYADDQLRYKYAVKMGFLNEDKKLTYNDFVRMVKADMMAGAAPDERPSEELVKKRAKSLYNDYLKGASVDDLFEAKVEVDDETEFKLNLKHLLDKHVVEQGYSLTKEHETDPNLELKVGDYQTQHFHMCPGAKSLYQDIENKVEDMGLAIRSAKLQDALFAMEESALENGANEADVFAAETIADQIMAMASMMGLDKEHSYIQGHVDKIKGAVDKEQVAESSSSEERRIAKRAIRSIAKYRGVSEDEARNDLIRAANELGSLEKAVRKMFETIKLGKQLNEELCDKGKRYIKARQAAGEKSSAYLSGRAVRVCKGQIEWPKKGKKK